MQHAHNPVNWYPWGEEALNKAKEEDKPIMVSIGYAACHWCHVMEKESFEDEETAALMNENFINIKVDREERPDIDHIYMDAVQAMTGSGGWPLNVFLTPDAKPFYGGTYFPPVRSYNRPSWKEILNAITLAYHQKPEEIRQQAENLTEHLYASNQFGLVEHADLMFSANDLDEIRNNLLAIADTENGGFGRAPKFPQTFSIQFLLRHYYYSSDQQSLNQAVLSLEKMIDGGINDHVGGGFARYSTDDFWLVPHFEKMLYDNALLVTTLSEAYQITGNEKFLEAINRTILFVEQEFLTPKGGFFSALDADSEGEEGKYYVWLKDEIIEILGEIDGELFCSFYDITEKGNWEGKNILRIIHPIESFAEKNGFKKNEFKSWLKKATHKVFCRRILRPFPLLDEKILLNWNALMNIACSKAFMATGDEWILDLANRNIKFLLTSFNVSGSLKHTWKDGKAKHDAYLDDLAFLIQALINMQEISGDHYYLTEAKSLTNYVIEHFSDSEQRFFYYTNDSQSDIIVRKIELYDGATPSGNSVMAHNLLYLSAVFNIPEWKERAVHMIGSLKQVIKKYPSSFGYWAFLLQAMVKELDEIVVTGDKIYDLRKQILSNFIPFRIFQSTDKPDSSFPLLREKPVAKQPAIYLCRNYICYPPVNDPSSFIRLLKTR